MEESCLDNVIRNFVLSHVYSKYYYHEITATEKNLNGCNIRGNIKYELIDKDRFMIILVIPPYILNFQNRYYVFDRAELGIDIAIARKNDNVLSIIASNPPRILNKNYHHPFVYSHNGTLAYIEQDFEKRSGFNFGEELDIINNPEEPADKIVSLLRTGEVLLFKGLKFDSIYSIHKLDNLDCLIADSKEDAFSYAITNGIKLERIFDNN